MNLWSETTYVLGIQRNVIHIKYVKEKKIFQVIILLCIIFVHLFIHKRECDFINQVGVKPVIREPSYRFNAPVSESQYNRPK